jgi:hypothetical protein
LRQEIIKKEIDIASIVDQLLKTKVRVLGVAYATETKPASNFKPKPKPKPRLAFKPEPVTAPLEPRKHEPDVRDDDNDNLLLGMDLGRRPKAKVRVPCVLRVAESQHESNLKVKPKLRLTAKPEPVTVPLKELHSHETDMRDDDNDRLLLGIDLGRTAKVKVRVPGVLRATEAQLASNLKAKPKPEPRLTVKPEPVTVPVKEPHRLEADVLDDDNNSLLLGADLGWTNKPKVRVPSFSNTTETHIASKTKPHPAVKPELVSIPLKKSHKRKAEILDHDSSSTASPKKKLKTFMEKFEAVDHMALSISSAAANLMRDASVSRCLCAPLLRLILR